MAANNCTNSHLWKSVEIKKVTISSDVGKHHIVLSDAPAQVIKIASVGHKQIYSCHPGHFQGEVYS